MPGKGMINRGPRRSAQDWRGMIEEWQESGIDLGEFCRERGVAPSSFRWWRWRLGFPPDRAAARAAGAGRQASPKTKDWIRLEIEAPGPNSSAFELRWPSGRILAIPADFDAEALSRLLAIVERSAC